MGEEVFEEPPSICGNILKDTCQNTPGIAYKSNIYNHNDLEMNIFTLKHCETLPYISEAILLDE